MSEMMTSRYYQHHYRPRPVTAALHCKRERVRGPGQHQPTQPANPNYGEQEVEDVMKTEERYQNITTDL